LPVLSGANYSVEADWVGDVVVEFSDREVAEYFGEEDRLHLHVVNGSDCNMSSDDPRSYMSPFGINGQAETLQLEEIVHCMIHGKVIVTERSVLEEPETPAIDQPRGRLNGTCQWNNTPSIAFEWNPWCFFGALGCLADGINPECSFCGEPPFRNCTNPTTLLSPTEAPEMQTTTNTTTTTAPPTTTTTTTTVVDMTIKSLRTGMCLSAPGGIDADGAVAMYTCNKGNSTQQWIHDEALGTIKNLLCLTANTSEVRLGACNFKEPQHWTYNRVTGQIIKREGTCLEEAPAEDEADGAAARFTARLAPCSEASASQRWSVGSWELPEAAPDANASDAFPLDQSEVQYMAGYNCFAAPGGAPTSTADPTEPVNLTDCWEMCEFDALCEGIVVVRGHDPGHCWLRRHIKVDLCPQNTSHDTWLKVAPGPPITSPPTTMTTTTTTATTTTTTPVTTTTTTTTTLDYAIRNYYGDCLSAPQGKANHGRIEVEACKMGDQKQRWVYIVETGRIKNEICMDAPHDGKVHMWTCYPIEAQSWEFDKNTGHLKSSTGKCLQGPALNADSKDVSLGDCDNEDETQMWNVAAWMLPSKKPEDSTTAVPSGSDVDMAPPSTPLQQLSDDTIRDHSGRCLAAPDGAENGGRLNTAECDPQSPGQRWEYQGSRLRNKACVDSPKDRWVHMWKCYDIPEQRFAYDPLTGLLRLERGGNSMCLASSSTLHTVHVSPCDQTQKDQVWSVGSVVREPASTDGALLSTASHVVETAVLPTGRRRLR